MSCWADATWQSRSTSGDQIGIWQRARATRLVIVVAILAFAHSSVVLGKGPQCFPREGHCIAVTVNGERGQALSKKTKRSLKGLEEVSSYVGDTRYEIVEPIRGEIQVDAAMASGAQAWFGESGKVQVQVVPLGEVELETREGLVAEPTVRVSGQAALGVGSFLESNRLPPGRYLLRVKVQGVKNWDRQTVFLTVAE